MSFHTMPLAAPRPGDSPKWRQALDRFLLEGIDARRPHGNDHQIKPCSDVSYYPDKGTILPDRGTRLPVQGLDALIDFLRESGRLASAVAP